MRLKVSVKLRFYDRESGDDLDICLLHVDSFGN